MRRQIRKDERGAALIETAFTLPILLLVCVGIFEFGRAYQTWQVLTNAAREGARVAILASTTDAAVQDRVRDYMRSGTLADHESATVDVNRNVAMGDDSGSRVTVSYPYRFMVLDPVVRLVTPNSTAGGPLTLRSVVLMRNEG